MGHRIPLKQGSWLTIPFWILALVSLSTGCLASFSVFDTLPAPKPMTPADLAGVWVASYPAQIGRISDQLTLQADGQFRQIYREFPLFQDTPDYWFESEWGRWWLEELSDGSVYVHLEGARYYLGPREDAERQAWPTCPANLPRTQWKECKPGPPFAYFDCLRREFLYMVGELVLSVRTDRDGQLVLVHMSTGTVTCSSLPFHRVAE